MTWEPAREFTAETLYLNTASMGLPPRCTQQALRDSHDAWAAGRVNAGDYDETVAAARACFARLVHVEESQVAVGHQASPLVGLLAAALPDGSTVLVAEGEFTSVTFPFAVHADRGVKVVEAPLADLAERVDSSTDLVAVAAVQSADGAVADLDAIEAACARHGAEMLVDLTQSAGWLDVDASRYAATVCAGYKWLLSPRGTAFLTVRPEMLARIRPLAAGWFAGDDVWDSIYGLPLRLAAGARRLDVSPAWHSWVGTRASLDFLEGIGIGALHDHSLEVAQAFAAAARIEPVDSAIVSLQTGPAAEQVLEEYAVMAARRAGRLRLSFHVNNTINEVEALGAALRPHLR